MRKLASVRRVDDVQPIEGADKIEVATLGGWKVVVLKDQFKAGDLGAFFEIDSFLPRWPEFEFLKDVKVFNDKEGFRLRTIKLRKQISQGLLLPLSDFAQFDGIGFNEGDDLTSHLEVVLWEPPVKGQPNGERKGTFPHFIRKTDEERVQNIPLRVLQGYKDDWFVETVKLDGSSMTVYIKSDEEYNDEGNKEVLIKTGVCSRNQEIVESEGNRFWEGARKYALVERLKIFFEKHKRAIAIQGELYGEAIQNNPWKLSGRQFSVFNIWSIDDQKYFTPTEMRDIIAELNLYEVQGEPLQTVPILREGILGEFFELTYDAILGRADEIYDMVPDRKTEGFVYKSDSKLLDEAFSFKAISNKYLLFLEKKAD